MRAFALLVLSTLWLSGLFGCGDDGAKPERALTSIEIAPTAPSVALGTAISLTATGVFSDDTHADLTSQVSWSSSDINTATVVVGVVDGKAEGTATISARLDGIKGTTTVTVTGATLMSIEVTPAAPSIALGMHQQFMAVGTFSDTTTQDLTTQVAWSSSDTAVATIAATGNTTTLATGATTITASMMGQSGTADLEVTAATLQMVLVTPVNPMVALGLDRQFTATGIYSDGTMPDLTAQATWASSDETKATVDVAGLATALAIGPTTITAMFGGFTGMTTLTVVGATLVSIAVTPTDTTIPKTTTQQFTAIGTYSDATTPDITSMVTWASTVTTVATISNAAATRGLATGVNPGTTMISATLGGTAGTTMLSVVLPVPHVVSTTPADGARGVRPTAPIGIAFDAAMNPATLSTQATTGACTGSVQVSSDAFATCIGLGTIAMNGANTVATATPAAAMSILATYKIRVLSSAADMAGTTLAGDVTQATGFEIATDGACGASVMIAQVYGAGGNTGATYNADFVELHNPSPIPQSIAGMAIQYGSAAGSTWAATPLPPVSIPAGGYFLVQVSTPTMVGAALTPDHVAMPTLTMAATAGKIALTPTVAALSGTCPIGATLDFVGYGTTANCFEGVAPTGNLSATNAAIRAGGGCTDANTNSTDFAVAAVLPLNSATPALVCTCTANETNTVAELDFCNLQFPSTMTVPTAATTPLVYGRVFETGVTEAAGGSSKIVAELGYGASGGNPATMATAFTWVPAIFNVQVGNDDEYQADFLAPATGSYSYTTRVSRDAVNWTYCDLNGAGSNSGLDFEPAQLGVLTVP